MPTTPEIKTQEGRLLVTLTPTYALVLATISTWMRHLGSGPLWQQVVGIEADACRRYWWAHILYINNYLYEDAHCAPQTWYLAADTQLFCVGLFVCLACRGARRRAAALATLLVAATVVVAAHTYFQDLDAVVIQSPEKYRNLYASDDTFRLLYSRGHTNLSTYVLGLAAGFLTYHWQQEGKDMSRFKKYRWFVWLCFPLGVGLILSGGLFYGDGARAPAWLRVLYAALYKTVFQFFVCVISVSCVFKLEDFPILTDIYVLCVGGGDHLKGLQSIVCAGVYRGIIEWRGFAWTGRVSYGAFLLHTLLQRGYVAAAAAPLRMNDFTVFVIVSVKAYQDGSSEMKNTTKKKRVDVTRDRRAGKNEGFHRDEISLDGLMLLGGSIFLTFLFAAVMWVCVEAPVAALTKAALAPRPRDETKV
ncbi:hypothetical protein MSG28_008974 [Choristoneura fumiferana]|uniref:Uncharacterized protein n=1 Tax=Choristoneura fumiferana TaxID=7141 RepID=A0ACC0J8N7_CHOFU|nr:hypothetical protein MSG28_008974 [Choristoneura fumiferana]